MTNYQKLIERLNSLDRFLEEADDLHREFRYAYSLDNSSLGQYGNRLFRTLTALEPDFSKISNGEDVFEKVRFTRYLHEAQNIQYYAGMFSRSSESGLSKLNILAYLDSIRKGLDILSSAGKVVQRLEQKRNEMFSNLSKRQAHIINLLIEGLDYQQIADELGISKYTVKTHVTNILRKTGHHSVLDIRLDHEKDYKTYRIPDSITTREKEIGELIAQGKTNKEIADQLCISEHTVKAHLTNMYRKLDYEGNARVYFIKAFRLIGETSDEEAA